MNAWTTTIISSLVLLVAFLQWRTAHQKVLLDLFDRRIALFNQIMETQRRVMREADGLAGHDIDHLHDLRAKANFLFGSEIMDALKTWHEALIDLTVSADVIRMGAGSRSEHQLQIAQALKTVRPFRETFPLIFSPYMRMDQKRVRTPLEWFHDRNEIRKTYGDQR